MMPFINLEIKELAFPIDKEEVLHTLYTNRGQRNRDL